MSNTLPVTEREQEILNFLEDYESNKGYSASIYDIQRYFKLSSPSHANYFVGQLEKKGKITRIRGRHRSISIIEK